MLGEYDVAIIGGGVLGAAAAWQLARRRVRVALLEQGDIASGASATNPGFLVFSYRENAFAMRLALEQDANWPAFQRELGADLELNRSGGLMPFDAPDQEQVLTQLVHRSRELGLAEFEIITAARARELEPALEEQRITGAAWCAKEGHLNPFRLNLAMVDGAKRLGAHLYPHTAVTGMEVSNGIVTALETPRGRVKASLFVVAAGAWCRKVTNLAGADVPIRYEKGEAMVTAGVAPCLSRIITDGALFTQHDDSIAMRVGCCLKQAQDGNVVIAQSTTIPDHHETGNTSQGLIRVARRTLRLFPSLAGLEVIRMWSGLISYVDDKAPVFGPLDSPGNLLLATAFHSAIGIAPAIGDMIADYYTSGHIPQDAKRYSPMRF